MIKREILNEYGSKITISENNSLEYPYCVEINDNGHIGVMELNDGQLLLIRQSLSELSYDIIKGRLK